MIRWPAGRFVAILLAALNWRMSVRNVKRSSISVSAMLKYTILRYIIQHRNEKNVVPIWEFLMRIPSYNYALFSSLDCSGKRPLEGPLKEELERALARAESLTQEYNNVLKLFEEEMFNTSSVLDLFNQQFGWVSSLANHTKNEDGFFKIQAVGAKYVIQHNCNCFHYADLSTANVWCAGDVKRLR